MTVSRNASAWNGGHQTPWWPLAFSLALHLALLLLPLPRGYTSGHPDHPGSSLNPPPLTVEFRSESEGTAPTIELGQLNRENQHLETVAAATVIAPHPTAPVPAGDIAANDTAGYLPPERLSHLPEILDMGNLELPGVLRRGDAGRLILEILISDEGRPDSIRVVETSVPAPFLANALRVFQWARYVPGRELNRAVRSRVRVEIVLGAQPSDPGDTVPPQGSTPPHRLKWADVPRP